MSSCRAIDHAALKFGTLAEQMEGSGIDRQARARARQKLAAAKSKLTPRDVELLRILAIPDADGGQPGPSVIGRRLGITRQSAARRVARFYRRVRRTRDPVPIRPPVVLPDGIESHLIACAGITPIAARRLVAVVETSISATARSERVSRPTVQQQIAAARARLTAGCLVCALVSPAPRGDGRARS